MSYVDELDLLFEATGPSRRDFNKSVAAAVTGAKPLIGISNITSSNVASTGATAAVSSLDKIMTALDSYYSSSAKGDSVYKFLSKVGRDKLIETQKFLEKNPDISFDEAQETHPLAEYFSYDFDHFEIIGDYDPDNANADAPFIDYNNFNSVTEGIIFNKLYIGTVEGPFSLSFLSDEFNEDLLKYVSNKFNGFKNFFSTLADGMADENGDNLADKLINVLAAVEKKAPSLYRSLGLEIKPSDIIDLKRKRFNAFYQNRRGRRDSMSSKDGDSAVINAEYAHDKIQSDFLGQLRENGLVGERFDEFVELHRDSTAKVKAKADKQRRIERQKETEERILTPRRDKKIDDEAVSRWEDEGGALGPLDEAIRRLMNVIR